MLLNISHKYQRDAATISRPKRGTTTLNIAHPFTTIHSAHHQTFYPIWPCNNIVHTVIDIYTGFILSQPMTNTSGYCYNL